MWRAALLPLLVAAESSSCEGPVGSNALMQVGMSGKVKHEHTMVSLSAFYDEKTMLNISSYPCATTVVLNASFNMNSDCPAACPFHAADKQDKVACSSKCVRPSDCRVLDPTRPVADPEMGACRPASVDGCKVPAIDGSDTCLECHSWFTLREDGTCSGQLQWLGYSFLALILVLLLVIIVWLIDLNIRPATNVEALKVGLDFRTDQKYHQQKQEGEENRQLVPLSSNLCSTAIGGPGLVLHFNFIAAVIVWASLVGVAWVILALVVDDEFLTLGTRDYGTSFKNCILVAWGSETQQRLLPAKLTFMICTYVFTFLGCLIFSVRQLRLFQWLDASRDTMKDFAAHLYGLPFVPGTELLEDEIMSFITAKTGQDVVGVSVAWNYSEQQDFVDDAVMKELQDKEAASGHAQPTPVGNDIAEMGWLRKKFFQFEQAYLIGESEEEAEDSAADRAKKVKKVLQELQSSHHAFVVFQTQAAKEAAVAAGSHGFEFRGKTVYLEETTQEPGGVTWQNFDNSGHMAKLQRAAKGLCFIFCGLFIWATVFYAPYAWAILTFNYDSGRVPGTVYGIAFSLVVTVGNVIMVQICDRVSDFMGFRHKDSRDTFYVMAYLFATLLNVTLDLVTTWFMAYMIMSGLGFRTEDGEALQDVKWLTPQFETYAMQRSLGQNMWEYSFPATFLIPFVAEPLPTIYLPLRLGLLLVRSHAVKAWDAKFWMAAQPLDLGRYADILLNVILTILIFYFPGGYTHWMFFALAGSSIYIYAFDHWRVLRTVPYSMYSTMQVDWWSQAVLAPCVGLLLSSLVFKMNCQDWGYCVNHNWITSLEVGAFFLHTTIHLLLLIYVVPMCGRSTKEMGRSQATYADVAASRPCSWFSANPVHCLRSRYIRNHSPACTYLLNGMEHLLDKNEKIGCYFTATNDVAENEVQKYELSMDMFK